MKALTRAVPGSNPAPSGSVPFLCLQDSTSCTCWHPVQTKACFSLTKVSPYLTCAAFRFYFCICDHMPDHMPPDAEVIVSS